MAFVGWPCLQGCRHRDGCRQIAGSQAGKPCRHRSRWPGRVHGAGRAGGGRKRGGLPCPSCPVLVVAGGRHPLPACAGGGQEACQSVRAPALEGHHWGGLGACGLNSARGQWRSLTRCTARYLPSAGKRCWKKAGHRLCSCPVVALARFSASRRSSARGQGLGGPAPVAASMRQVQKGSRLKERERRRGEVHFLATSGLLRKGPRRLA